MPTGIGGEKLWLCPSLDDSANDLSGNSNNGTYNGGMTTVSDTASGGSRAYSFDGLNDYIDCGAASTIHSNSVFTYSLWIKASSNTGTTVGVFGAYDHTTGDRGALFAVGYNFSNKGAFYYQSVGSTYNSNELLQSTVNVVDGTWHHIVCVFDGVNGRALFYRDGTLVGNTASNVPSTVNQSTDFLVGRGAAANFSGYVDDARIFDRALSTTEITHLATSRGIEGSPYTYSGLGDEKLWLCPSLDDSADDISGNGNHGTYNGGMGTVADTSNGGTRAYSFDKVDDYINTGNSVSPTSGISMCAWVNLDTFPASGVVSTVIEKRYIGGIEPFTLNFRDPTNIRAYYYDGTIHGVSTAHSMSTGNWHHIAGTFDGSTWKVYKDGSLLSSVADSTPLTTNADNVLIGASTIVSSVTRFFDGLMDDIRIFDRALSTSEITSLASKRGYEVPAAPSGSIPHVLSSPFHPLG